MMLSIRRRETDVRNEDRLKAAPTFDPAAVVTDDWYAEEFDAVAGYAARLGAFVSRDLRLRVSPDKARAFETARPHVRSRNRTIPPADTSTAKTPVFGPISLVRRLD